MTAVFVGYLFIFIHLRANGIDFLPDFVGYILIAAGVSGLPDRNVKFVSTRNLSVALAIYTGAIWFMGVFRWMLFGSIFFFVSCLVLAAILSLSCLLIAGFREVERTENVQLGTGRLLLSWGVYSAVQIMLLIFNMLPIHVRNLPLQLLSIGNIAALLLFLAFLFITRTKYLEFCTRRKYMNKTDCP